MPRFRFRFVPRDDSFFELFTRLAAAVEEGAETYVHLLAELHRVDELAAEIRRIEHDADEVTHEIARRLNTVFVTPMDHEDIHGLASALDDVLDHVEAASDLVLLQGIDAPLPEMKSQGDVLLTAAAVTSEAVAKLPKYKELGDYWEMIDRLERDGDRIYRRAIADLFGGDHRAMDVLKWKAVIDEAEAAIDQLEDVADVLEAIVLKQS